jgi:hypothetical protein
MPRRPSSPTLAQAMLESSRLQVELCPIFVAEVAVARELGVEPTARWLLATTLRSSELYRWSRPLMDPTPGLDAAPLGDGRNTAANRRAWLGRKRKALRGALALTHGLTLEELLDLTPQGERQATVHLVRDWSANATYYVKEHAS